MKPNSKEHMEGRTGTGKRKQVLRSPKQKKLPKHGSSKAQPRSPSFSPIPTRIAEVVTRDLGDGWRPIGIIEARIKGRFCDVRTVCSTGVSEIIRTYYQEEVERGNEAYDPRVGPPITDDDIPF